MSPRPYQLGKRQAVIDEGRRRILDAARALLRDNSRYTAFTVDAVAKQADVARGTVYYQFGSKTGLLEALCDDLAEAGQMGELARAFTTTDPDEALAVFVAGFARFWAADRVVMRRLRALAALDPDVGTVIAARDERARTGLRVLLSRRADAPSRPEQIEDVVRLLHALISFETFDAAAGPDRDPGDVVPAIVALIQTALSQQQPRKRQR